MKLQKTLKITYSAAFIALSLLLPMVFHMIGGQSAGGMFLPMHIPVLLGGLLLGPYCGLIIGILSPVLSYFILSMPPVFLLPIMMTELAFYGFFSGLLMKKTKNVFISQYGAMILGRLGYALAFYIIITFFNPNLRAATVTTAVITGIAGIIIQAIMIPILYKILEKAMKTNGK